MKTDKTDNDQEGKATCWEKTNKRMLIVGLTFPLWIAPAILFAGVALPIFGMSWILHQGITCCDGTPFFGDRN